MGAEILDEGFNPYAELEQIRAGADRVKERSFYSRVLVDTFFGEVDPSTVVTAREDVYLNYVIGGRIKDAPKGTMRLEWSDSHNKKSVKLIIAQAPERDKDEERAALLHDGRYYFPHTIESNGESAGMFSYPNEDGTWTQEVVDSLTFSFYPTRMGIAPANPDENFNYWLLTDFVPRFLNERVAPLATVPLQEMTGKITISNPEI